MSGDERKREGVYMPIALMSASFSFKCPNCLVCVSLKTGSNLVLVVANSKQKELVISLFLVNIFC